MVVMTLKLALNDLKYSFLCRKCTTNAASCLEEAGATTGGNTNKEALYQG